MRIRDPIHGTIHLTEAEGRVLDHPYFQRLRHIRQLGFGEYAFPGATHSRLSHSLGATYVATRLFDAMAEGSELPPKQRARFRATVRLAVLGHDLGHLPLSHSSEQAAPSRAVLKLPYPPELQEGQATHEDYTLKVLLDSELRRLIEEAYRPQEVTPEDVAALVSGLPSFAPGRFSAGGYDWLPALRAIVSGELDADRMDYLVRDSFFTGVNYGRYDHEWILQNLSVGYHDNQAVMALSKAAVFAFEDFLLSRYHMFLAVYYHHTSVGFEQMLGKFYGESPTEFSIPSDIEKFLHCDDIALYAALRASSSEWARRIVRREPYRRLVQVTARDDEAVEPTDTDRILVALDDAKLRYFTAFSHGVLSKHARARLTGSAEERLEELPLYVGKRGERLLSITDCAPLYRRLESVRFFRVFIHPDDYEAGQVLLEKIGAKDV